MSFRLSWNASLLVAFSLAWGPEAASALAGAGPEEGMAALARCEDLYRQRPGERESVRCFRQAVEPGTQERVVERLEELRREHPEDPWLAYYLAGVEWAKRAPRVPALYGEAAELLHRRGDLEGEVDARRGRARFLALVGRLTEAEEELGRLRRLVEGSGDPVLRARVHVEEAAFLLAHGGDLEQAWYLLQEHRDLVLGAPGEGRRELPEDLRRSWLEQAFTVAYELGRYGAAEELGQRLVTLSAAAGDAFLEASHILRLALVALASRLPSEKSRGEIEGLLERALELAQRSGNLSTEVQVHRLLGQIQGETAGRGHLERCVSLARAEIQEPGLEAACLAALAVLEAKDPQGGSRAEAALGDAEETLAGLDEPWLRLDLQQARARVSWEGGDRQAGWEEGLAVLRRIEELRAAQAGEPGRAGILAARWEPYLWLAGELLDRQPETPSRQDLERAFQVMERMRGRILLEAVAARPAAPAEAAPEQAEVEGRRVALQRRLSSPDLPPSERRILEGELGALEQAAAALRHGKAQARGSGSSSFGDSLAGAAAGLGAVEAALAEDEALLSFQHSLWQDLYGRFGGGSWAVVSTRQGSRAYALAGRAELEPSLGLLADLEDPETAPELLIRLYRRLLEPALEELPPQIRHLVIVPDGDLHRLPFGLLRPTPSPGSALAARYQLSLAPSATLWLHWRSSAPTAAAAPALVLADPVLSSSGGAADGDRDGRRGTSGRFLAPPGEALPYARQEGRRVVGLLGGGSRLRLGTEASESFLKAVDPGAYAVLHFAAHARVSAHHPQRSALFLAPGGPAEDGWVQPREIAALRGVAPLVVLAACDSAAGEVVRGEGVMSLARPFFEAGARAVVGSRRPLPDREAARLFEVFYRHLAAGASTGRSLALARRERIEAGGPASGWGSVVLLGDGSFVPFPGGLHGGPDRGAKGLWWPPFRVLPSPWVAVAVLGLLAWVLFRRRSSRGGR